MLLIGHVLEQLRQLPENSAHCVVTSPPYWRLRDYGTPPVPWPEVTFRNMVEGEEVHLAADEVQLGQETGIAGFVGHLVLVARELARVLRPDGSMWLNLGDTYDTHRNGAGVGRKNLCGIPWRVALALQADGWILRADCVWHKTNPMPGSVKDRPTTAHEMVFLLTRRQRYYYDNFAERTPHATRRRGTHKGWPAQPTRAIQDREAMYHPAGRDVQSVWRINCSRFAGAHYATFPPELARRCVRLGTPRHACRTCGAPWTRRVDVSYQNPGNRTTNGPRSLANRDQTAGFAKRLVREAVTTGWEPGCEHESEPVPGIVVDPFVGAGTVPLVATELGRSWVGIDNDARSRELLDVRLRDVQVALPVVG